MNKLPALTAQQRTNLLAFHKSSVQGKTQLLDPSDPKHRDFIETMLSAAGRTKKSFPHLFGSMPKVKKAALKTATKKSKEPDDIQVRLVDAGKTKSGKATATIWANTASRNLIKGGNLMAFDSTSGKLLAQGENTSVRNGFLSCPTRSATAADAGKKLSLLYLGHSTDENGNTRYYSYADTAIVSDQAIQVTVSAPVINYPGNKAIEISVGRTGGYPVNSDYTYYETGNLDNPYLISPFAGTVPLSGTIDLSKLTVSDLDTRIFVNNGNGGTIAVPRARDYTTDAAMVAAFSVGSAPNILRWNFPYDQKGYKSTKSIVYNPTSLANEVQSYFYFAFNSIPFADGSVSPPFFVCSTDTPEEPSINCTKIPNLYYWWHCLAKGTPVMLEDGSFLAIENIHEGHRVRTGISGKSFAVRATVHGYHACDPKTKNDDLLYTLITANGKRITGTENHMVFTSANSCIAISELKPGDNVMTDEGLSKVKTNKLAAHKGMFYGMALGNDAERAQPDFPHHLASYYGGGVLCGDQEAMRHSVMTSNEDPEKVLPKIKPELHADYLAAYKSKRFGKPTTTTLAVAPGAAPAASSSIFSAVYYTSPYATMPPGFTTSGILVQTTSTQSPPMILVIRLRQASNGYVIGISPTSGPGTSVKTATLQPSFPLSATDPYMVDLIWVPSGTPPENIDWNSATASSPVLSAEVTINSATYDGTNVYANLSYGAGLGTGAQVNVFSLSSGTLVNVGKAQTQNSFVTVPVNAGGYPPAFFISAQSVIPVTNTGNGSFTGPFSFGPQTVIPNSSGTAQYGGIPQAISALSAANYDGATLTMSWTLASVSGCVVPDSSLVQILSGTQVIATFKGGVTSANFPLNVLGQSNISATVCSVTNNICSKPVSINLITQAPVLSNVAANISAGTVTASYTTTPASLGVNAVLMEGTRQLQSGTGTAGTISLTYAASGKVGLTMIARAVSGVVTGPPSLPVGLLATQPALYEGSIYTCPTDSTKWQIDLYWNRLPDDETTVSSYTVTLYQGATSLVSQTVSGTSASLLVAKTAVTAGQTQSIQLSATSSSGGISPVQTSYVVFSAPALTSLITSASQIQATWTAPTIPAANTRTVLYRLAVSVDGKSVYTGPAARATQAAVPLSELALASGTTVLVMAMITVGNISLVTDSSMGTAATASPILLSPVIGQVSTSAATNIQTLNWTAIPDSKVNGYSVKLLQSAQSFAVTANKYTLAAALLPGAFVNYTVQGIGTNNGVALTGPPSAPMIVPTNCCNVTSLHYNGSTVTASWEAESNASGYNVLVYDNSNPAVQIYSGTSTTPFASFAAAITDASKVYTLYIQPLTETGSGLSGATKQLFNPAFFLSLQPSTSAYPYIYPGLTMAALGTAAANPQPQAITLYLPELGSQSGALGTTQLPAAGGPFTLTPLSSGPMPYKLTIAGTTDVWGFSTTAVRATLLQSYVDFLELLETPGGGLSGAVPYGISLVQAAIACVTPQSFAEQLYFNFGYSTSSSQGAGYIDLRPGMILRVSTGDYVSINQNNLPSWINGYSGASVLDFEIGGYTAGSNWRTGFDAFLNVLAAAGALTVSTPAQSTSSQQAGLAGAVDLYYPQFVQPFYRLYIPSAISSAWGNGSNTTTSNFTLVAAQNYTALQSTTVNPSVTSTAYFRGRTTVEVMIKVLVNNNEHLVPVGTTVGNLLEQLNLRPSATSPLFNKLRMYRSIVPAMNNVNTGSSWGPLMEVMLDWKGMQVYTTGNGLNTMSLPLMPGDQFFTS